MDTFAPPPCLVDPAGLPPVIMTSAPGSFAHHTLRSRIPAILQETISLNDFPAEIRRALDELYDELTAGTIRGLLEETADRAFWDAVNVPWLGRSWLAVPWYWAEAYFYRRILEATRYFQPGRWAGFDPYAVKKRTEWAAGAAPQAVERLLRRLPDDPHERFVRLLHASLWGNRTDLSYQVAAHLGRSDGSRDERSNLLVDDTEGVWGSLSSFDSVRHTTPHSAQDASVGILPAAFDTKVLVISDNAGAELLMDLALIDGLLAAGLASQVSLHLKPQPFFVSDAMPKDVEDGLAALPAGGAAAASLAGRLRGYLADGRLRLATHWFYTSSLFYFQLPADLLAELAAADLVIVKGDANYRRLLGDAHWLATIPFAQAVSYFPAPVVALRTLKGEIITGLAEGQAARLAAEDPAWLVNGQRGVIQAKLDM